MLVYRRSIDADFSSFLSLIENPFSHPVVDCVSGNTESLGSGFSSHYAAGHCQFSEILKVVFLGRFAAPSPWLSGS